MEEEEKVFKISRGSFKSQVPKRVNYAKFKPESKVCPEDIDFWITHPVSNEEMGTNMESPTILRAVEPQPTSVLGIGSTKSFLLSISDLQLSDILPNKPKNPPEEFKGIPNSDEQAYYGLHESFTSESDSSSSLSEGDSPHQESRLCSSLNIDSHLRRGRASVLIIRNAGIPDFAYPMHVVPPQIDSLVHKKTVLLDLDQTLIFSYIKDKECAPPKDLPILYTNNLDIPFLIRQGAIKFVEELGRHAEIILYSAGTMEYIQEIIARVPAFSENIHHIICRDDCLPFRDSFLKSGRIKGRKIEDIIIIDDSFWIYPC